MLLLATYLLLAACLAKPAAAQSVSLDFEHFPGPDGILGTADDVPSPTCPGPIIGICDGPGNGYSSMGITFTSGLLGQGEFFPGSPPTNHFITSSPPDATFSRLVTGISITSYSFWTATLYALDENDNVIASDTLTNPNAGSSFLLGTLSVSTSRPIRRFTVLAGDCQIGGGCDQIVNLDNLVLTSSPVVVGVPTLSEWGFGGLLVLLVASGLIVLSQRPLAGA
jgi:hypothetical protein